MTELVENNSEVKKDIDWSWGQATYTRDLKTFDRSLNDLVHLKNDVVNSEYRYKHYELLYAHMISIFEVYLSDTLINFVYEFPKAKQNLIGSALFKKEKYTLSDFCRSGESIDNLILEKFNQLLWHNLDLVKDLYKVTLNVNFPDDLSWIYASIKERHDIVHRNGESKSGEVIEIDEEHLDSSIKTFKSCVYYLNDQLINYSKNYVPD